MKRMTMILLLLLAGSARAGWLFNETNTYYVTLTDNAALSLPDGDWTISGWIKLTDNTGTALQYFLSWGMYGATPSFNWYITEASYATSDQRNELTLALFDVGGDGPGAVYGTTQPGTATTWRHFLLERSGYTVTQYINGIPDGTWTVATFDGVDVAGNLYFGMRQDGDADRCFGGYLAEWAKWDRVLTQTEKEQVAGTGGYAVTSPADIAATSRAWYVPMYDDFNEDWGGLTVTNNGDNVTVDSGVHPVNYASSGGGGGSIFRSVVE